MLGLVHGGIMKLFTMSLIAALIVGANASANNDLIGNWKTKKVECVGQNGTAAPKQKVNLDLAIEAVNFTAIATLDKRSCTLKGTYEYVGGTISFKVTDDGGCPIGNRRTAAFDAKLNGREAIVSLTGIAAAYMCDNQPISLDIIMQKK